MSDSNQQTNDNSTKNDNQSSWNILAEHNEVKVIKEFVIRRTNVNESIDKDVKDHCKVLHFSSNWNFEDVLAFLDGLDCREYPYLVLVIIVCKNFEFQKLKFEKSEKIKQCLLKFDPLVIQLISEEENVDKFYYKEINTNHFLEMNHYNENYTEIEDFPTLLYFILNNNINHIEQLTASWKQIIKSSLSIKFIKLFENLPIKLILEITKCGTKADLLNFLEAQVEHDGRLLSIEAQNFITKIIHDECSSDKLTERIDDDSVSETSYSSNESADDKSSENDSTSSILLTAIEHKNTEITDYLISYWTHLIQQHPFDHQLKASNAAFKTDQFDVLCDLLEIADYPFPEDFEFDDEFEHKRLRKIAIDRVTFSSAIKKENFKKIDGFIDKNLSLKYAFNLDNDTALTQAIESKKFGVFYYLQSQGFEGGDYCNTLNELKEKDRKKAEQQAAKQRKSNVNKALVNVHKSILLLATRSLIHNRKIKKEQEAEYRQKIMSWLKDIHNIAPEMLEVAASCENLKIIFDFESSTVENASLAGQNSLGSTYANSKWIFIGAKISDKKREQRIKGVLAHELCHYVMRLVYENQENPYYKYRQDMKETFEKIVGAIDKWSKEGSECPDDECFGIISTVFTLYPIEEFHLELIVRVVQIMVEFDFDKEKSIYFKDKYENLFNFWNTHVVHEMKLCLEKNLEVKKLNGFVGLLPKLLKLKIETKKSDEIENIFQNKLTVVSTNNSKLLFWNICKTLKEKDGILMDSKNFFVDPEKLNNLEVLKMYNQICRDVTELNIIVDCTSFIPVCLKRIFFNKDLNFIFVVSNETQREELTRIFDKGGMKDATNIDINFNWNDLTYESTKILLELKINFQNNSAISFNDLFIGEIVESEKSQLDLSEIFDDELLTFITENKEISVNSTKELDTNKNYFEYLSMPRKFLKKKKIYSCENKNEQKIENIDKISEDKLLLEVKNHSIILISDIAGNGKSWALKNLTKTIRENNPNYWVTYVDLKQFIKKFKGQIGKPEFSAFIADKILKPQNKFELKIFQRLYNDGKVYIIFDGFDEIAPNYAEFVLNLSQSFQSNGGNQLWIATRDYFEVELQDKLNVDFTYGLDEMYEFQGVNLIAKSWILKDLEEKNQTMSVKEFNQYIERSADFKKYKKQAEKIVEKVTMSWNRSVGMPQMFKMITDGYKDEKHIGNLMQSKIYEKFIENLYRRWSRMKGIIRENASIKSQNYELNFWKFHQYHAILTLFPILVKILFPGYTGVDWLVEEVIACGLMSVKDGNYYFLHETIREYFAADALVKALKTEKIDERVLQVFTEVLTTWQYKIIRMFINENIDPKILDKIQPEMKKIAKKIHKIEYNSYYFPRNIYKFVDLLIFTLLDGDYENVKEILEENSIIIFRSTEKTDFFLKFQDFLHNFLKIEDPNILKQRAKVLGRTIKSRFKNEAYSNFILEIGNKTGHDFIQKELRKLIIQNWIRESNNQFIFDITDSKAYKLRNFIIMLQTLLPITEMLDFFKKNDIYGKNILSTCLRRKNIEILRILWTEIENYFGLQNMTIDFKELIMQQNESKQNILHDIANCEDFKLYTNFWDLLLTTFNNREELNIFTLQKDNFENNFLHNLVLKNKNSEIIKWTFLMMKENFNESQFEKIVQSRGKENRSLYHNFAFDGKNIKMFKLLWAPFSNSYKSEKDFCVVFNEVDEYGRNILNYALWKVPKEFFNFLIEKLVQNFSNEDFKKILSNTDKLNKSLLHSAVEWNESSDIFKVVWNTLNAYLKPEEILKIVKQVDNISFENFLFCIKSSDTFKFAMEELEKIVTFSEIKTMLCCINKYKQTILQKAVTTFRVSLDFYATLWKYFQTYFTFYEISSLLKNLDQDGYNLFNNAVVGNNTTKCVIFTWIQMKPYMNQNDYFDHLKITEKNISNVSFWLNYHNLK